MVLCAVLCLGCGKSSPEPPSPAGPTAAQQRYQQSQAHLMHGEYEQAYRDYQGATASDPALANVSYLSSVLYGWAISQSATTDTPQLEAQKQVMLTPGQFAARKALLSISVNGEAKVVYGFGVGLSKPHPAQANRERVLAREAALVDAHAWVARMVNWSRHGVEHPFDVNTRISGVKLISESWLIPEVCVVKVEAPLEGGAGERGSEGASGAGEALQIAKCR